MRDLFFGFPNSYGTLGYALRLTARTLPVKPYVRARARALHRRPHAFFAGARAARATTRDADFLDGIAVRARRARTSRSAASSTARRTPATTRFERIYYRSIRERATRLPHASTTISGAGTPTGSGARRTSSRSIRSCAGFSAASGSIESLSARSCAGTAALGRDHGAGARCAALHAESVIQDVDIPIERAAEFLAFFAREIGIVPDLDLPDRRRRRGATASRSIRCARTAVRQLRLLGRGSARATRIRRGTSTARSSAR